MSSASVSGGSSSSRSLVIILAVVGVIALIVAVLYFHKMRHDPSNPALAERDRFLLSKGHAALVQYAALALAGYFRLDDARVDRLAEHLLTRQMADGGWNCRYTGEYGGATHGSFHTTILALEALLEYERFRADRAQAACAAQARGREFLLIHRLFKSHRTGAVVKSELTRLAFPPQWHFDILRGLDYFRASGAPCDERLSDALQLVEKKRTVEGRWLLENVYSGKTFFTMETKGRGSRWNTLRALRVLKWAKA